MVKFMCKCVSIEQDGPFEEQRGIGRMQQNLTVFRNISIGNCVESRGLPVRAPPPKTTASCCQRPPRSAPFGKGLPLEAPSVKKMPPVKVPRATQKAFPCEKMEVSRIASELFASVEDAQMT